MTVGDALRLASPAPGRRRRPRAAPGRGAAAAPRPATGTAQRCWRPRQPALAADQEARFFALVEERDGRRPLQHLTGHPGLLAATSSWSRPTCSSPGRRRRCWWRPPSRCCRRRRRRGRGRRRHGQRLHRAVAGRRSARRRGPRRWTSRTRPSRWPARTRVGSAWTSRVRFHQGDLLEPLRDLAAPRRPGRLATLPTSPRPSAPASSPRSATTSRAWPSSPCPTRPGSTARLAGGARRLLRPGGHAGRGGGPGHGRGGLGAFASAKATASSGWSPTSRGSPRVVVAAAAGGHTPRAPTRRRLIRWSKIRVVGGQAPRGHGPHLGRQERVAARHLRRPAHRQARRPQQRPRGARHPHHGRACSRDMGAAGGAPVGGVVEIRAAEAHVGRGPLRPGQDHAGLGAGAGAAAWPAPAGRGCRCPAAARSATAPSTCTSRPCEKMGADDPRRARLRRGQRGAAARAPRSTSTPSP